MFEPLLPYHGIFTEQNFLKLGQYLESHNISTNIKDWGQICYKQVFNGSLSEKLLGVGVF